MVPRFALEVTAHSSDIDEVNHVSNLVYVRWIQEVAVAHSASLGWDVNRYRQVGAIFMVRRHEIDYITPVTVDQAVRIETWIESWKAASCVRRTEIVRASDQQVVARGNTRWAYVGLQDGRPQRIPAEIQQHFGSGSS
jgi:acyl-CoA thioester hydrolase